jgi:hypothetical protein
MLEKRYEARIHNIRNGHHFSLLAHPDLLLYMSSRSEEARLRAVFDERRKTRSPEHSDVGSLELRPCISIRALHER